jgi:ppGpp synthetase/RelA/SpoT-type nucleotidyltranferase
MTEQPAELEGVDLDIDVEVEVELEVADEQQAIRELAYQARIQYERDRGLYRDFAYDIARLLEACLTAEGISIHTITAREKNPDSFERKAAQTSPKDPTVAKYTDPLNEITDKAAVRVTTYFLETVEQVSRVIKDEFSVIQQLNKTSSEPDRLGYQSVHYLVQYPAGRTALSDFRKFNGLTAEIQVRTILQHAWAEIEHDIQYKAVAAVPERIRRRFTSLAGLVEIADREFQAIANEDVAIKAQARIDIDSGQLDQVEITRDSFREYVDKKYGPDGRMREWSYDWAVRVLLELGFTNLKQIDECIGDYDDDTVSRAIAGSRLGQLTRFEHVLLASMGYYFAMAHPWSVRDDSEWFPKVCIERLHKLRQHTIRVGSYKPSGYPNTRSSLTDMERLEAERDGGEAPPSD